ncbi:MAG: DUF4258 domain-containing protein [Chloroflexi bacterium]|nr:DUF4258 domain-containing protein [Chloroflexota bacterium]
MAIRFSRHAREKFEILARHKFVVTEAQVIDTLNSPDKVETDRDPPVAQKTFDERHVLRVVFRVEGEDKVVVTFYPVRRQRYEN